MEDLYDLRAIVRTEQYLRKNRTIGPNKINKRKIYCDIYFIDHYNDQAAVYTSREIMGRYSVTMLEIIDMRIHVYDINDRSNGYNLYNDYCPNLLSEN